MAPVSEYLARRFAEFHSDPLQQFRVRLRRFRAAQLRDLLAHPEALTLDDFNHEIWRLETRALVDGVQTHSGEIFNVHGMSNERLAELDDALARGRLEYHGNSIWGSGTRVYGLSIELTDDGKLEQIRTAARILTDDHLTPLEKAEQVKALPGFGPNSATGLVLVFHPEEFSIWNEVSKAVVGSMDGQVTPLEAFQNSVRDIRNQLKADDFLEVDWFFYLLEQERKVHRQFLRSGRIGRWQPTREV